MTSSRGSICGPFCSILGIIIVALTLGASVQAAYQTAAVSSKADEGPGFVVHMHLADELLPEYGPSFKALDVEVTPETIERLHVKIRPSGVTRWEVPESVIPRPGWDRNLWPSQPGAQAAQQQPAGAAAAAQSMPESTHIIGQMLYAVHQPFDSPGNPFALKVIRQHTGNPIFDSTGHRFVFKDQYIELSTNVPEDADLYGLGETTLRTGLLLPRDGRIITLYNSDTAAVIPNANLYGSHPFLLQVNKDGSSHGVFFLNSNGMDVVLNKTSVTYKVIGGLVDLYFFLGPSPEAVIRQYHQVIGAPAMPPYWALGVHQGRWGYKDVSVLEEVVANYTAAGIPLECLWLDIEYMGNRFRTLTYDQDRFPVSKMRAFVDKLHQAGQRWVPIHDSAIAKQTGYKAYEDGSRLNVWIKEATGEPYVGQVWPGPSVYPDYLSNPNVTVWLKEQLQHFYNQVPYDGLWLDMNEASNFCSGVKCRPDRRNRQNMYYLSVSTPKDYNLGPLMHPMTTCVMSCEQEAEDNKWANPPYQIHNFWFENGRARRNMPIGHRTISPTAVHADGTREYDAHNLFGTTMALRNAEVANSILGKRGFYILRSTSPGAGRVTGHWTGDNGATWQSFYESIAAMLNSNMWGIAMSGADVCGFWDDQKYAHSGDANTQLSDADYQQLCNRWTAAGAWYPYSRNHYTYDARSHEPYQWPDVAAAARKAYGLRYRLLTYLYSSMHLAHSRGGTLARPLFVTHPADAGARNATKQWMMGEALLISPVLMPNATTVRPYFTTGSWYSAWDFSRLDIAGDSSSSKTPELQVPYGDIAVHLRGGTIVPMQEPALVTRDVRLSPITLLVALPAPKQAGGDDAASAGPLPPYSQDEACAGAYSRNPDQLVSCGYIFMDSGEELQVTRDNSIQAWFVSTVAADGRSGNLTSIIDSNAGEAKGKLRIESVKILGLPQKLAQQQQPVKVAVAVNGQEVAGVVAEWQSNSLHLSGLGLVMGEPLELSWRLAAGKAE